MFNCVLTGDIVGSTDLTQNQQKRVMTTLESGFQSLRPVLGGSFDSFRGDGWQMQFAHETAPLRIALYLRATIRADDEAFETRVAIASSPEQSNDVFVQSGRALDTMPKNTLFRYANGGDSHATAVLADHISHRWTQAQARAVRPFLFPSSRVTQKTVAAQLGISRQAVGQALDAAGLTPLMAAITALETQANQRAGAIQ